MPDESIVASLPGRLVHDLQRLARKYRESGIELFIFGSFARGDPSPTSDLDLGVEWRGPHDPAVFRRLYWDVQALPTIRPIDLVDFGQVDADFKRATAADRIYLSAERDTSDEN